MKLVQTGNMGMGVLAAINAPYRGAGVVSMSVAFDKIMGNLLRYGGGRRSDSFSFFGHKDECGLHIVMPAAGADDR